MNVKVISNPVLPASAVRGLYGDGTAPAFENFSIFGSVVGSSVNFTQCLIIGASMNTAPVGSVNVVLNDPATVNFYNLSLRFKGIVDEGANVDVSVGGDVYLSIFIGTTSLRRVYLQLSKYKVFYNQEVVVDLPDFSDVSVGSGENVYFYFEYHGDNAHNGVVVNFDGRVGVDD